MERTYRVAEFAELSGVTVKALHHYDRLGLLRPARSPAGYRIYKSGDLERLQQIVALRFLGLSLKAIRAVLDREALPLSSTFRHQRAVLEEQRDRLERAIGALADAEHLLDEGKASMADVLRSVIGAMSTQDVDVMRKYYSEDAWEQWRHYYEDWPSPVWQALYRDVNAALGEDPRGEVAQALAARWLELKKQEWRASTTDGRIGMMKAWGDRDHWPPALQRRLTEFNVEPASRFIGEALWAGWEAERLAREQRGMPGQRASETRRALFRDCVAALDAGPRSRDAQAIVAQWNALLDAESGGDAETREQLLYAFRGRKKWPLGAKQYVASLVEADVETWERVQDFLEAAADL